MDINQTPRIQVIDSIESQQKISLSSIEKTLTTTQETLIHGDKFTGKPGTQIFTDESYVVKLHSELEFKAMDAVRWIEKKLENERQYHIYVPSKTWFVLEFEDRSVIANITPVLLPLHQAEKKFSSDAFLEKLQKMFDTYLRIAAEFHKLLDGGLSNFALDEQDQLYYLDDDIYEWDKFTAFCTQTGVLIRQLDGINSDQWKALGHFCHDCILEHFKDRHQLTIAYEQFREVFMSNDEQKASLQAFVEGFYYSGNKDRSIKVLSRVVKTDSLTEPEARAPEVVPVQHDAQRFAVMADIHANLPALEAVLAELEKQQINSGIILGDVVGYGPHPDECIELLKQKNFTVVKGNHDHAVANGIFTGGFSATGRYVAEWSTARISEENKQWLDQLPPYLRHDNWLAVHGSPMDKTFFNGYVYQMTFADNLDNLQQRNIDICFHGHSHVQGIFYRRKKQDDFSKEQTQLLKEYDCCLVCPGSVGQPRSNIAGAEYAIYDPQSSEISLYRIDYDMQKTMADMAANNFPSQLIERLPQGK